MDELKACPFCGPRGLVEIDDFLEPHHYEVYCDTCGWARNTVKAWNTRPIEDALRGDLEKLARARGELNPMNKRTWGEPHNNAGAVDQFLEDSWAILGKYGKEKPQTELHKPEQKG